MRFAPVGLACRSASKFANAHSVSYILWCSGHAYTLCMRTSFEHACVVMSLVLLDQQCIMLSLVLSLTCTDALPGTRAACLVSAKQAMVGCLQPCQLMHTLYKAVEDALLCTHVHPGGTEGPFIQAAAIAALPQSVVAQRTVYFCMTFPEG
ncbi:TPA: hypothetical protein ACH3X2_002870 [Trebouxia sp. C0005]